MSCYTGIKASKSVYLYRGNMGQSTRPQHGNMLHGQFARACNYRYPHDCALNEGG